MSYVSKAKALEALDNLDDYASMPIGVDAIGPRETLRKFIEQTPEIYDVEYGPEFTADVTKD